jgi:hypothetical protein
MTSMETANHNRIAAARFSSSVVRSPQTARLSRQSLNLGFVGSVEVNGKVASNPRFQQTRPSLGDVERYMFVNRNGMRKSIDVKESNTLTDRFDLK